MADKGPGGSRLPLALPAAPQGSSSGGGGASTGGSGHPPPPRNLQGLLQMAITAGSEEPDPPPEPMSEEVSAGRQLRRGRGAEVAGKGPWPLQLGLAGAAEGRLHGEASRLCCARGGAGHVPQAPALWQEGRGPRRPGHTWLQPPPGCVTLGGHAPHRSGLQASPYDSRAGGAVVRTDDPVPCPPPGLVREQEAGLLQFLRLDGFSVLMRAMQQQVQKLKVKSAFLLQNLLLGHPEHKGTLCSMGMVQQLVALVRTEHSAFHEHVLGALCRCVDGLFQSRRPRAWWEPCPPPGSMLLGVVGAGVRVP
ncbi:PREDICTED: hsp70-binding protein 1 [Condylura cristata]|uniref:hsp70-binding protein 1 n=1 Tax=Condylura cristata TaxID=143302 RepID=UPI000643A6C8|nr:PREDICTED: hsp70-binding protein 1 [Condylura cristata]